MSKKLSLIMVAAISSICLASVSAGETAVADANTTCPVMQKEAVKSDLYVDYKGERIYLCCTKCKNRFNQDPAKYVARVHAQKAANAKKAPKAAK